MSKKPKLKKNVVVVGAGVAGLTAAHELAVRGFKVHVVETAAEQRQVHTESGRTSADVPNPEDWLLPAVGGMARTQYTWVPPTGPGSRDAEAGVARPATRVTLKVAAYEVVPGAAIADALVGPSAAIPELAGEFTRIGSEGADGATVTRAAQLLPWVHLLEKLLSGAELSTYAPMTPLVAPSPPNVGAYAYLGPDVPLDLSSSKQDSSPRTGRVRAIDVVASWHDWFMSEKDASADRVEASNQQRLGGCVFARSENNARELVDALALAIGADPLQRGALVERFGGTPTRRVAFGSKKFPNAARWLRRAAQRDVLRRVDAAEVDDAVDVNDLFVRVITDEHEFRRCVPPRVDEKATAVLVLWVRRPFDPAFGEIPEIRPGEHGYRFFPSFYKHVFDTMKRTPIVERGAATPSLIGGEVARTVFDNLVSNPVAAFGFDAGPDGRSRPLVRLDRAPKKSLVEGFRTLRSLRSDLGFEMRDMLRIEARTLAFMTMSRERRATLENVTWTEFLKVDDGYSPSFRKALETWPAALVGLKGREADARSFGAVLVQQVLDTTVDREVRDATLNGPVTNAWFDPWRTFLMDQLGVRFHLGTATKLKFVDVDDDASHLVVHAEFSDPKLKYSASTERDRARRPRDPVDNDLPAESYLVLAVSALESYRLMRTLEADAESKRPGHPKFAAAWDKAALHGQVRAVWDVLDAKRGEPFMPGQLRKACPDSPLRHYSGIQFFAEEADIALLEGHVFLPDHPWGLSLISQSQFGRGRTKRGWSRGVVSFDIGAFDQASGTARSAYLSTPDEIARETWAALRSAVRDESGVFRFTRDRMPPYHLDDALIYRDPEVEWSEDTVTPSNLNYSVPWMLSPDHDFHRGSTWTTRGLQYNNFPFLITRPGAISKWPGRLDPDRPTLGYEMIFANLVLCGTYTQTFMRLITMEAANESGRHAVNAILRDFDDRDDPGGKRGRGRGDDDRSESRAQSVLDERRFARTGYCDVWPMEDEEPAMFDFWKDLDRKLFQAGLPHMFDILRLDESLKSLMQPDSPSSSARGEEILATVTQMISDGLPDPKKLSSWASPFVVQMISTFLNVRRG